MKIRCTAINASDSHLTDTYTLTPELLAKLAYWTGIASERIVVSLEAGASVSTEFCIYTKLASVEKIPDYLNAYCKLTRVAIRTDRSAMTPAAHREFMTLICRAQQILRLEALQAGFPDFETLPTTR
jgi:hypothetical protein